MVRTVTQIMGEYGLNANGSNYPLADQEKATMDAVMNSIKEFQSVRGEQAAGRGMGLSTFEQQATTKSAQDLMSSANADIIKNRMNLANDLISKGVSADIASQYLTQTGDVTKDVEKSKQDYLTSETLQRLKDNTMWLAAADLAKQTAGFGGNVLSGLVQGQGLNSFTNALGLGSDKVSLNPTENNVAGITNTVTDKLGLGSIRL